MDNYKRTVYFDMDGVLADFEGGFYKISGTTVNDVTDEEMWASIGAYGKAKFFSELEWMAGGKEIWQYASDNFPKVKILSALGRSDKIDKQTTQGKLMWIRHNIPSLQLDDIILVDNKHRKRHYCKQGDIIIDDTSVVIDEWTERGGVGILYKTASDTIARLKQYVQQIMKESKKKDIITEVIPREKLKALVKLIWEAEQMTFGQGWEPTGPKPPVTPTTVIMPSTSTSTGAPSPIDWSKKAAKKPKKTYKRKPTPITGMERIKSLDLERDHMLAMSVSRSKPKKTAGWFSNKMDKSKYPFFNKASEWLAFMFKSNTYIGPDLTRYGFDMKVGDRVDTESSLFKHDIDIHLKEWNDAMEKMKRDEYPGEYSK